MSENTENTNKTKSETVKIDGVSAQINLSPGSETHHRFAQLMREAGAATARSFVETLMDAYQNPHTDNSDVIEKLKERLKEVLEENDNLKLRQKSYESEIAQLKLDLAAARNEANDNAAKAQKMLTETEGCIILHPNPVSAFFLKEMAEKTGRTPGKILEKLFIDDLQNPRSNNLPYDVRGRRVREVMEQLKKEAKDE